MPNTPQPPENTWEGNKLPDINTKFLQTETCANIFSRLAVVLIFFITLPIAVSEYFALSLPNFIGWFLVVKTLHRLEKLSPSVTSLSSTAQSLIYLTFLPFIFFYIVALPKNDYLAPLILLGLLLFVVAIIFEQVFFWNLHTLVMSIATVGENAKIYRSARRIRLAYLISAFLPTSIALVAIFTNDPAHVPGRCGIEQALAEAAEISANTTIFGFGLNLILTLFIIHLLLRAAKMCREYSQKSGE